ncbi:MAG: YajQ family cyclic di-GMP-binding protein [Candidatus Saccharibacteria bacterium]|jgi:uncharacterized protein YajQ (UPF0234 family)
MAKDASFDIVSEFELVDMINAVDQVKRELATRYDFQGTGASVEFDKENNVLRLVANSELKVRAIGDVVESKFIKRGLSLKFLDKSQEPVESGMEFRWTLPLVKGLDQEKAKALSKLIRDKHPKVKPNIQGESVRVTSASKDELQAVMQTVRSAELDYPVGFTNYR